VGGGALTYSPVLPGKLKSKLEKGEQGDKSRGRGSGMRDDYKKWKGDCSYDKNVVFPTSASPSSRILTSGGSAIPTRHPL
jgi:hypothetical protein